MTASVFLKLWYRCGFSRDSFPLLSQWKEEESLSAASREFLECVNTVDLYHMHFRLPLRLEAYNNLLNEHPEELCNRDTYLVIEDIAPVGGSLDVVISSG